MQIHEHNHPTGAHSGLFFVTESAAARINTLKSRAGAPDLRFRVVVKGGGCSGFQYEFKLDGEAPQETDYIVSLHGADVMIDDISLELVKGATLDYTEDLAHAGFEIKNPQATSSCGCGNSFSVAL